jgi:hypothetical protein
MNDEVMSVYAASLFLGKYGDPITEHGYFHFTEVLCKKSSILNTFGSNHTLQTLIHENRQGSKPRTLMSLLKIKAVKVKQHGKRSS